LIRFISKYLRLFSKNLTKRLGGASDHTKYSIHCYRLLFHISEFFHANYKKCSQDVKRGPDDERRDQMRLQPSARIQNRS
jgi:hypothetical protein